MGGVFLSYRRHGESAGYAGHLADELQARLGAAHVFRDIDTIPPGQDFVKFITDAVGSCAVFLVVIGPDWLTARDAAGHRRLDDPEDFVRVETAAALSRDVPVIPVLVGGAAMPLAQDLPHPLKPLARRQAIELSDGRWRYDVEKLCKVIDDTLPGNGPKPPSGRTPWARRAAILAVGLAAAWMVGNYLFSRQTAGPAIASFDATPATIRRGEPAILRWQTAQAAEVSLNGRNVLPSDSLEVHPASNTTYRLIARGSGGQVERSVAVRVRPPQAAAPPEILGFEADRSPIRVGEVVTLHWHTANAQRVMLDGKPVAAADTAQIRLGATTTYQLTATNGQGVSARRALTVQVTSAARPVIRFFEAVPPKIAGGAQVRLCYGVTDADNARIDPGIGPVKVTEKDCLPVQPSTTTTYMVIAFGRDGQRATASVTVEVTGGKPPHAVGLPPGGQVIVQPPPPLGLSAPTQLAPPNDAVFATFPRTTVLTWSPVATAQSYTVELDCQGCCGTAWCADAGHPWRLQRGLTATTYRFDFVGAQPGRWRVWAVDAAGHEGAKSSWWQFRYTK